MGHHLLEVRVAASYFDFSLLHDFDSFCLWSFRQLLNIVSNDPS